MTNLLHAKHLKIEGDLFCQKKSFCASNMYLLQSLQAGPTPRQIPEFLHTFCFLFV